MKNLKFILLIVASIMTTSFVLLQKDKEQLIRESLNKRIENYKMEKLEKCYKEVLLEAESTVDSIIAIELGAGPIDTLDFPRKPQKPQFEPYDSLKQDTVAIKPLFDKPKITQQEN